MHRYICINNGKLLITLVFVLTNNIFFVHTGGYFCTDIHSSDTTNPLRERQTCSQVHRHKILEIIISECLSLGMYDRKGIAANPTESTRLLQNSLRTAQETSELARLTNIELRRQEEKLSESVDHVRT